ncbi:hypothetical protein [Mycobacterium sp. DL99]|uniref:hypothetical protein n=1 Tax=Mycobacterium sp. DL99 TaxID=2528957 RepID=UPI001081C53F|nr:hypothetical protein [Mycobacterium sp. DL99]
MANSGADVIDGGGPEEVRQRTCFFVSPLGDDGSPERKRSDDVRKYILIEALEPLQYKVTRADLTSKAGDITEQIVSELLNADLVVADLSDHNPNVFYEIALRHAFGKPFIHMIAQGQRIPFDIAQQRTVFYDITVLDSVYAARRFVREAAQEILNGGDGYKVVSPVTRSVNLDQLRTSGDPEQLALADLKTDMEELRAELRKSRLTDGSVPGLNFDPKFLAMREVIENVTHNAGLTPYQLDTLREVANTAAWQNWVKELDAMSDRVASSNRSRVHTWSIASNGAVTDSSEPNGHPTNR